MTMAGYDALYLLTLVTVSFGALTFSVLALFYWRERRSRPRSAFAAFTGVCAAAFLINLLLRMAPRWEAPLTVALDLVTGLLPPLLLHVALTAGRRPLLIFFYALAVGGALALGLDDLDLVSVPFRDQLSAVMLGTAGGLGAIFVGVDSRPLRRWYRFLLGLTGVVAAASLANPSALTMLAPDYLLLAFFCVTLYYQERLVFFDLLIKRTAFFGVTLGALTGLSWFLRLPDPVTVAVILTAFCFLGPWADARLGRWIDRLWLRRPYSPADAERLFNNELQLAVAEEDLRSRVERCLATIFQGAAEVRFGAEPAPQFGPDAMVADLQGLGWVMLKPRGSGIPYMSDDRRLFDSFARTLAVVLENVRFREQQQRQQEREQQLRLLASRAELKALRAQINPHFLFNALNAIAGLIPSQPDLADRTLEELAQVFRYTLRKSDNEWVRLDEEAEFVGAYLRVEQARFGERLQVEVAIDPAAGRVPVPSMCIQPLIENAVKHGASLVEGLGAVGLRAAFDGEMVRIEVYDNGPGFPDGFSLADSDGHGLRNVAERLNGYYGDVAQLRWESATGSTRVLLEIPCQPAAEAGRGDDRDARTDRG